MKIKFLLALSSLSILTASLHALPSEEGKMPDLTDSRNDDGRIRDRDNSDTRLSDHNGGRNTPEAGRSTSTLVAEEEVGAVSSQPDNIEAPTSSSAAESSALTKTGLDKGKLAQIQRLQNKAFFSGDPQHPAWTASVSQRENLERRMNEVIKPTPNTWLESWVNKEPVAGTSAEQLEAQKILIKCSALKLAEPAWKATFEALKAGDNTQQETVDCWAPWRKLVGLSQSEEVVEPSAKKEEFLRKLTVAATVWEEAKDKFDAEFLFNNLVNDEDGDVSSELVTQLREEHENLEQNAKSAFMRVQAEVDYQNLERGFAVYQETGSPEQWNQAVTQGGALVQEWKENQQNVPERFKEKWDKYIESLAQAPSAVSRVKLTAYGLIERRASEAASSTAAAGDPSLQEVAPSAVVASEALLQNAERVSSPVSEAGVSSEIGTSVTHPADTGSDVKEVSSPESGEAALERIPYHKTLEGIATIARLKAKYLTSSGKDAPTKIALPDTVVENSKVASSLTSPSLESPESGLSVSGKTSHDPTTPPNTPNEASPNSETQIRPIETTASGKEVGLDLKGEAVLPD